MKGRLTTEVILALKTSLCARLIFLVLRRSRDRRARQKQGSDIESTAMLVSCQQVSSRQSLIISYGHCAVKNLGKTETYTFKVEKEGVYASLHKGKNDSLKNSQ
jgi:hypothetical protein